MRKMRNQKSSNHGPIKIEDFHYFTTSPNYDDSAQSWTSLLMINFQVLEVAYTIFRQQELLEGSYFIKQKSFNYCFFPEEAI